MVTLTEKKARTPHNAAKHSSGFASKIKAKILNTSSFFKVSLKGNNKALAKALAVQSEKTRHLIQETVLLRQRILALNFDLAIQRHKKKKMFAIIQHFYNISNKSLSKAINLLDDENESFDEDEDADHAEDGMERDMFGSLLQAHDKPPRDSKAATWRASQFNINTEQDTISHHDDLRKSINSIALSDCLLPKRLSRKQKEIVDEEAMHQQTLVCNTEMDITAVDSVAPIVTVDTKTSKSRRGHQNTKGTNSEDSCDPGQGEANNRTEVIEKASVAVVLTERQGVSSEVKLNNHSTNADVDSAVNTGNGDTDFGAPRRKTHFTSRKMNRMTLSSQKGTGDLSRKTYIISPNTDMDGFSKPHEFGGIGEDASSEEDSTETRHNMKTDVLPQCETSNSLYRKTYVISDRAAVKMSQRTDPLMMDDHEPDCITVMDTGSEALEDQFIEPALVKNTEKKRKTTRSLSATNQSTKVKRREKNTPGSWGRGSTERRNSYFDEWSDFFAHDDQQEESIRVISTLQEPNSSHADITTETLKSCNEEALVPLKVSLEPPAVVKPWKMSDFLADEQQVTSNKSKKGKTGKSKEKKALQKKKPTVSSKEKRPGNVQRSKKLPDGDEDQVLDEHNRSSCADKIQTVNTQHLEDDGTDNSKALEVEDRQPELPPSPESSYPEVTGEAIRITKKSRGSAISKDQPTHDDKIKSRDTFVISTCSGQGDKETSLKSTSSKSVVFTKRQTFVYPVNSNQSEALPCRQTELLGDERPPWESLDFDHASPFPIDTSVSSPPSRRPSCTMEIYQEDLPSMSSQSPEGRPMKSLTNTDWTTDAESGRSRRRGAQVSYKEPPINAKQRRGDKFSDTQFLRSPIFKSKRIKKKHKA